MLKMAIVGGRDFNDYELLEEVMESVCEFYEVSSPYIISGGAKGADACAKVYAKDHGFEYQEYPADWEGLGRSAGFARNLRMADAADVVVAFWDKESKGTKHMIDQSLKKGKDVLVTYYDKNSKRVTH
jgi:hypothetical protein